FGGPVIAAGVVFPALLLGLRWRGLEGLTVGYALASAVLFAPGLVVAYRQIDLCVIQVARCLTPLLLAASGMGAAVLGLRCGLLPYAGSLIRLVLGTAIGAVAYLALLQFLGLAPATRARSLWKAFRGP